MYPVLVDLFGISITSYGVSKALAAFAAVFLLTREFRRLGWNPELATTLVVATTLVGFLGGKLYYLGEHADRLTVHHLGGAGFTWYGGFLAGLVTFVFLTRRHHLPLATTAAVSVVPLSIAYGIGRVGCFLAGDGTYGQPTDLPWGMAFPNGTVPTTVAVHPTALYEALAAFAIAAALWHVRDYWHPYATVGAYAVLAGAARFLVEVVRINDDVLLGLTAPQLWSLVLVGFGAVAITAASRLGGGGISGETRSGHPNETPAEIAVAPSAAAGAASPRARAGS